MGHSAEAARSRPSASANADAPERRVALAVPQAVDAWDDARPPDNMAREASSNVDNT